MPDKAAALYQFTFQLACAISTPLGGALYDTIGFHQYSLIMASLPLFATAFYIIQMCFCNSSKWEPRTRYCQVYRIPKHLDLEGASAFSVCTLTKVCKNLCFCHFLPSSSLLEKFPAFSFEHFSRSPPCLRIFNAYVCSISSRAIILLSIFPFFHLILPRSK